MGNFFTNLIARFFGKTTVDSVIADIAAKVEQLHIVAQVHAEAEQVHLAEINLRNKLVAEARTEWTRAKSIAIELAYDLMMARKPAYMMGREIGEGLVNLIKKQQAKGVDQLVEKLEASTQREIERAKAKGDVALTRYEEILTRLVAAQVANDHVPEIAAQSAQLRKAAALLETHFQAREVEQQQAAIRNMRGSPI